MPRQLPSTQCVYFRDGLNFRSTPLFTVIAKLAKEFDDGEGRHKFKT